MRARRDTGHSGGDPAEPLTAHAVFSTVVGLVLVLVTAPLLLSELGGGTVRVDLGPWVIVGLGAFLLLHGKRRLTARASKPDSPAR